MWPVDILGIYSQGGLTVRSALHEVVLAMSVSHTSIARLLGMYRAPSCSKKAMNFR